ncbi:MULTISPECIES: pentapeptide repeat-containing protein [unclassified Frankia]|uniref:pentapeptide repeat-containing protein n=1 Tax=unclassified Frankia TaxID=2632575 RepID=UPI0027DE8BF0|nr:MULTISPECIES: pentapeptide repeat-containing protein [unclassified Frankia]
MTILGRLPVRDHVPRADLSGADLTGTQLKGTKLTGTQLNRADLTRAQLDAANLTDAQGLTQGQEDVANGDTETRLPPGLARPPSWPPAS